MAYPFKSNTDEHTKEVRIQEFYNSLDNHLKGEYGTMQVYRSVFKELKEVSEGLQAYKLSKDLGYTISTIDKFLQGDENVLDVVNSMPIFNSVLETMIIETKMDLSEYDEGDLIY